MKNLLLITFSLIVLTSYGQIDCVVDVTIAQGASATFCQNEQHELNASDGYVSYFWSGPQAGTQQNFTPNISGTYQVEAVDNDGCTSTATIDVTINPPPTDDIISSEGNPICPSGSGSVLSLSGSYVSYNWSNSQTSPTILALTPDTYSVEFTDANSCVGTASIDLDIITYSLINGADPACAGGTNNLIASGGQNYVWSTGEIGPTIEVIPIVTTSYAVTISGAGGNCPQILTIEVSPPSDEDTVFNLPDTVFVQYENDAQLTGPAGFATYIWEPTNQLVDSTSASIPFTAIEPQWIYLTATHASGCMIQDSVFMYVLYERELPNGFSPNGDNMNDLFVIPDLDTTSGDLIVWNRYGDVVFEQENYQNDWDGTCKGTFCLGDGKLPEGTYFYMVTISGIQFKNFLTIKL